MIDLPGQILLLSGGPGTGKTTTAELLAKTPGTPKVHLHTDSFWGFIKHGYVDPWLPEAHPQNQTVLRVAASAAHEYARGNFFVIAEGFVGPWALAPYRHLAEQGLTVHHIILQTTVQTAITRCQQRGGTTLTDPAVIQDLHHQLSSLGPLSHHLLPIENLSSEQVLQHVLTALESRRFLLK